MVSKSRKHANTVKLDAVVSKAIEKAVYMRKVAALSAGAAGVIASAAIAFGATPAMAAEANPAPVKNTDTAKEQNLVDANKGNSKTSDDSKATKKNEASKDEDSKKTEPSESKKDQTDNKVAETQDNKSKIEPNLTSNKNASAQSVVKAEDKKQIENNAEQKKIAEQKTASTESVDNKTTTDKTSAADRTNATSRTTAENSAPAETTVKKSRSKRSIDENKQPETPASTVAQGEDRAGNEHNPDEVAFSKNLPNIYGWATPSNTFDTKLAEQQVVYHLPKSADGKTVVRVVILPDSKDSINTDDPEAYKKIIEFDSARVDEMHQSYSGIYELKTNTDGSVDLVMKQPFRDGGISSGQGYCANRSIFLYYDKDNLQHDQTSNNFRVATLVPPKTAGSIVLKYDERLSADKVREVLHNAVNLPTEHKSGSSVADQLVAQSKSAGVGLRVDESTVNNTPDTVDAKIPQGMGSYDGAMFGEINKTNDSGDYSFGERKLKTYLVTDLGMKSPEIPLTVVRYSTRIEKPVVDTVDFSKLTEDQKTQIRKNLAKLNGVSTDKVTFDNNGNATIDFDGLSPQDNPKIPLSDLVLTRVSTDKVAIPSDSENSKVKAVVVANPLGYSQAELKQIKKAIYEANKDNQELGLSAKDYEKQISLEYLTGDTTASGGQNTGISNGMNENKITVTIRTDKAYAQFESDIQKHELTRLIDLRKDYTLSWDASNNKISGRTSDEGLAWMEEGKTLVYRYDPDKGEQINTKAVLGLLKATVKSDVKTDNPQLRENLLGTEIDTVKREGSNGQARRTHRSYTVDDKGEPIGVLNLVKLNGSSYGGFAKPVDNSNKKMGDEQSSVGDFTFDDDSKKVNVAGKTGKFMLGRLFIEPYSLYYYNYVYGENKYNLRNTPKGINVVFVPQTKNKIKDLKNSVGEHKTTTVDNKEVPTVAAYYNASADKKAAYDDALKVAQDTLTKVGNKTDADLTEELKAEVDNATITLNKAREALDGDATKKEELNKSIDEDGTPAQGQQATTGTKASDKYKNVTELDFKDANGNTDTTKNEAAKKAKTAYDDALTEANKVKEDKNATQKAVDDAKAKLDAARKELDKYTTNKDKLNAAIAEHGKVNTGDADKQGDEKLKTADPTYQNSTSDERTAYDNAVKKANELSKDPNASQKDVNKAIEDLKKAKAALDAKATDKSQLITAEKLTFDNPDKDDATKQSTFYKNALNKQTNGANDQEKQAAKTAVDNYNNALAKAREVLKNDKATQKEVDEAKQKLEAAEKVLHDGYKTDANDLTKAIADNFSGYLMPAYFNAFDKGKAGDTEAATAFKNYNDAYQKAKALKQKLDAAKTGGTAPTQEEIDAALTELNKKREALDAYKTDTTALSTEAEKSQADGATAPTTGQFEDSPEFKNADDKKGKDNKDNDDVAAYKKALEAARNLVKAATDTTKQPSERPTQQQVDEALDALKKAKKQIEDNYKTDTSKLEEAKKYANGDFKKTPEYKNAKAINDDQNANQDKKSNAKSAIDALDDTVTDSVLKKAKDIIENPAGKTQKEVDDALDALQKAMDKVTNGYKTDTDPLEKEVGDKTQDGKLVTPPFEESIPYKNALYKKQSETGTDATADTSATKKLQDYNDKFEAAKKIIDQVKNPDPNADPDKKPTNADVKTALEALQKAKKAIDDAFTTNAKALKDESAKSTADGVTTVGKDDFEATTEFKNADSKKTDDGKDNADITAYRDALKKARALLEKFGNDNKPKSDLTDVPSQKEVDEALQKLKEIKDKILADYKTSSTELQQEVDKSKDGDNDKRDDVFENTPAFKNATAKGDDAAKKALKDYNDKLTAAKTLLANFDRTTGKPKTNLPAGTKVPTQKQLYDALDALQAAKKKITEGYKTDKSDLNTEAGKDSDFTKSPEYQNAAGSPEADDYKRALDEANAVLKNPNATQAEVDEALKKLQDAKQKLADSHKTDKSDLNTEAGKDPDFRKSIPFIIGKAADLAEYQQALNDADSVLKDPNATQAQVDQALRRLRDAKQKLIDAYNRLINSGSGVGDNTGVGVNDVNNTSVNNVVDKGALQAEVDAALGDVSANANGVVADSNLVSEFNAALNYARSVLAECYSGAG